MGGRRRRQGRQEDLRVLRPREEPTIAVKLPESADHALATPGATPTSYGLGSHGWVTVPVGRPEAPVDLLQDWIEESYRAIATKRLVDELDARTG